MLIKDLLLTVMDQILIVHKLFVVVQTMQTLIAYLKPVKMDANVKQDIVTVQLDANLIPLVLLVWKLNLVTMK